MEHARVHDPSATPAMAHVPSAPVLVHISSVVDEAALAKACIEGTTTHHHHECEHAHMGHSHHHHHHHTEHPGQLDASSAVPSVSAIVASSATASSDDTGVFPRTRSTAEASLSHLAASRDMSQASSSYIGEQQQNDDDSSVASPSSSAAVSFAQARQSAASSEGSGHELNTSRTSDQFRQVMHASLDDHVATTPPLGGDISPSTSLLRKAAHRISSALSGTHRDSRESLAIDGSAPSRSSSFQSIPNRSASTTPSNSRPSTPTANRTPTRHKSSILSFAASKRSEKHRHSSTSVPVFASGRWQMDADFVKVMSTPPANALEEALYHQDDGKFQSYVRDLRIACRRIVKDRLYQFA